MAGYSRKLLRDSVQRLIQKGAGLIGTDDLNLSDLLHNFARSARTTTVATETHLEDMRDRAKNIGETVFNIAKSVDSLDDLEQRIKSHKGEIIDAAKTFSDKLREVLMHLAEPTSTEKEPSDTPHSEISLPAADGEKYGSHPDNEKG